MHFLAFIPNISTPDPQHLVDVGLGDLVEGARFMHATGPDGQPGMTVAWSRGGMVEQHVDLESQDWFPAVPTVDFGSHRYWLGFWNDAPPSPSDLARHYQERGKRVTLGDGCEWLLPRIRELPRDAILKDDGTWRFEVQRRFHELWNDGVDWFDRFVKADDNGTVPLLPLVEFVVRAVRVNYRITPEVVSRLKLLSTDLLLQCALTIVGALDE